ncbi:hypothetical protein Pfo_000977 [Paulownia fortunei]|nr:hypothetical protein Pfo_000977 [Paulownia fortunei]
MDVIKVLMLPWLSYGHITSRGKFKIYLWSTPATLSCIEKKITQEMSQTIELKPLLLRERQELPRELHTTNGLPPHIREELFLEEAFEFAVSHNFPGEEDKPDLLIYDFLPTCAPLLAKDRNIPAVQFITSVSEMFCSKFPCYMSRFARSFRPFEYTYWNTDRYLESARKEKWLDEIVLIKGFRDIDRLYINFVSVLVNGTRFVRVGPLLEEPSPEDEDDDGLSSDVLSWLDKKERKSTVYVAFGTEHFLTREYIAEIAYVLELSKLNFIWVVRFPKGPTGQDNGYLAKALPKGFLERVGNRGKILEEWAPQTKILGHPSIGGFVSNCGWNSVLESMNFGVPIIAVPMRLDQRNNAYLVRHVGVGDEVERAENQRIYSGKLASVIKNVMMDEDGGFFRQKAADMREKLRSKGDHEEIDEVVRILVGLYEKRKMIVQPKK